MPGLFVSKSWGYNHPMNYLAHIALANKSPAMQLGAIIGDLAKGPLDELSFSDEILSGIQHHRQVDTYTDQHEAVLRCWARFPAPYRRIASIIVDVAFDWALSHNWPEAELGEKSEFITKAYEGWKPLLVEMPDDIRPHVERWIAFDVLQKYESMEGVSAAFHRIADRRPRLIHLRDAIDQVELLKNEIEADFLEFWPQIFSKLAT